MNGRFYVYALVDPRDGSTVYIGKGCGNRSRSHLRASHNLQVSAWVNAVRASGHEPTVTHLAEQLTEEDALAMERRVILETPGVFNITRPLPFYERERLKAMMLIARMRPARLVPPALRAEHKAILRALGAMVARPQPSAWLSSWDVDRYYEQGIWIGKRPLVSLVY